MNNCWYLLIVPTSVISSGDLHCCLLPQCEALRICRSGFPIATITIGQDRNEDQFKNWKICGFGRFVIPDRSIHKELHLSNKSAYQSHCDHLDSRQFHPKVSELLYLLQCDAAYLPGALCFWRDITPRYFWFWFVLRTVHTSTQPI